MITKMKCKNCGHEIGEPTGSLQHTFQNSMYILFFGNNGCTNPEVKEDEDAKNVREFNDRWNKNPEPKKEEATAAVGI